MKITEIVTIRLEEFPNLIWVQVHTDEGVVGLGETFFGAAAVETYLHEQAAPRLLGEDPLAIERHARALTGYLGFQAAGAETRGNSAVDIALWDLWGRATGQPVCQLLGGCSREAVRTYNTCAGYRYIRAARGQHTANWGLPASGPAGPYEDLDAFMNNADELAHSLLEQGITGMKVWPFDPAAERSHGLDIAPAELEAGLEVFRKIRQAVGDRMDVMVECHSLWNLPTAVRIAHALEEFRPYWIEDPIRMTSMRSLAEFRGRTRVPVTASETLAGKPVFREMLELGAVDIVMLDLSWVGGLTEARKIAAIADAYQKPVAPHDCTGPVVYAASAHLSVHAPNALVQESVRAFYTGWYTELVTALPVVEAGMVRPPAGPGLGTELLPDLVKRPDAIVRRSATG